MKTKNIRVNIDLIRIIKFKGEKQRTLIRWFLQYFNFKVKKLIVKITIDK